LVATSVPTCSVAARFESRHLSSKMINGDTLQKESYGFLLFYPKMLTFSSLHLVGIEHFAELDVSGGEKYVF
jgi:hypothetical protein